MATQAQAVSGAVIVVAPDKTGSTVDVDFDQVLHLYFAEDCRFCCDTPDAFNPPLPDGDDFKKHTHWGPAFPDGGHDGDDARWDTVAYGTKCKYSAQAVDAGTVTTNAGLANVIHIGSGGATLQLFDVFTEFDDVSDVLSRTWRHTEDLLIAILEHSKRLSQADKGFVELFLESGNRAYRKVHKEE